MTLLVERVPDFEFKSTSGAAVRLSATLDDHGCHVPRDLVFVLHRAIPDVQPLKYEMWRHLDVSPVSGPNSGAPDDAGSIRPLDAVAV